MACCAEEPTFRVLELSKGAAKHGEGVECTPQVLQDGVPCFFGVCLCTCCPDSLKYPTVLEVPGRIGCVDGCGKVLLCFPIYSQKLKVQHCARDRSHFHSDCQRHDRKERFMVRTTWHHLQQSFSHKLIHPTALKALHFLGETFTKWIPSWKSIEQWKKRAPGCLGDLLGMTSYPAIRGVFHKFQDAYETTSFNRLSTKVSATGFHITRSIASSSWTKWAVRHVGGEKTKNSH